MSDNTPGAREDLLRELALRLSTYPGDPRNSDPQLLVGQIPENMAIPVPMPEQSQVLGTLMRSPENIEIMLDSTSSPEMVLSFYKERMAESGWNELDEMRHAQPGGGFVHSGFSAFENRTTFCKGPDSPAFTVNAYERKQGHTDVRLDIDFGNEYSPCRQSNRIQRRMAHHVMRNLIPPLVPPKGASSKAAVAAAAAKAGIPTLHWIPRYNSTRWSRITPRNWKKAAGFALTRAFPGRSPGPPGPSRTKIRKTGMACSSS